MITFKHGKEEYRLYIRGSQTVEIKNDMLYIYDINPFTSKRKTHYRISGLTNNQESTRYRTTKGLIGKLRALIRITIREKQMGDDWRTDFDTVIIIGKQGELLDYCIDI